MKRRGLSRAFNIQAVRLVANLDAAKSVLHRWMQELTAAPAMMFPGKGEMRADLADIAALKKEIVRLRAERDMP